MHHFMYFLFAATVQPILIPRFIGITNAQSPLHASFSVRLNKGTAVLSTKSQYKAYHVYHLRIVVMLVFTH